jgi:hypothetical protein
MAFLPPDVPAWDDASNNLWLVSGKGAMITNRVPGGSPYAMRCRLPSSAGLRLPGRTEGRCAVRAVLPVNVEFSKNKEAADSLAPVAALLD